MILTESDRWLIPSLGGTLKKSIGSILVLLLLPLLLSSCGAVDSIKSGVDSIKSGFEHSQAVAADLEKAIGKKPFVGFNWNNGSLSDVSITFDSIPAHKSLPEIYEAAKQSIQTQFKQQPQKIIISFAVTP